MTDDTTSSTIRRRRTTEPRADRGDPANPVSGPPSLGPDAVAARRGWAPALAACDRTEFVSLSS